MRARRGCRFRLLLLSRRCGGARSRRSGRWSRLGCGDFLRHCFYLRGRFWRRQVRWPAMRARRGCRFRLLLLSRRCGGARSRRSGRWYSVRSATVSVLVSPAWLVFRLTAVGEPPGVPEGFAPSRFGGTDLFPAAVAPGEAPGALGDPPGTFLFGDCFSSGEPGVVGFPPGPVGEPPGVPEGFTPSRFGGTDLFPAAAALGEAPRVAFGLGEPAPGFTRLGGDFCSVTAGGEPVVPGDPACPFLPICEFT